MFKSEYGEAAVEVLDILDNTNKEDVNKIPSTFIKFLVDNASEDYVVNLDHTKPISELNIMEKTKEILGTIYINWWCDENERQEYMEQIQEQERRREEELREKYNPDNMFKNRQSNEVSKEIQNLPVEKKNENIFNIVINKIKKFFGKF